MKLVKSFDLCPCCKTPIQLVNSSSGTFSCPACGCIFRHNRRKWIIGLPLAIIFALILLFLTRDSFIPPIFIELVAAPFLALIVTRGFPNYIVVQPPVKSDSSAG
jgi:predicted RNA-binding Zn-ribbon protein involved in translation (DUF1610 family)